MIWAWWRTANMMPLAIVDALPLPCELSTLTGMIRTP